MLTIKAVEIRFAFYKEIEDEPGGYEVDEYETVDLGCETEEGQKYIEKYLSDDRYLGDAFCEETFWVHCPRENANETDDVDAVWIHFDEDDKPYATLMAYGPVFDECFVQCSSGRSVVVPNETMTIGDLKAAVQDAVRAIESIKAPAT